MVSKQPVMFTAAAIKDKSPTTHSLRRPMGSHRALQTAAWGEVGFAPVLTHTYIHNHTHTSNWCLPFPDLTVNISKHLKVFIEIKCPGMHSKCPPPNCPDMLHLLQLNKHVIRISDDTLQPAPWALNIMVSLWSQEKLSMSHLMKEICIAISIKGRGIMKLTSELVSGQKLVQMCFHGP